MNINIDPKLIARFNKEVNQNFLIEKFQNVNGKNQWNIICSAMDWITLTANGLPSIVIKPGHSLGHNHMDSLNLMQYIVAIDLMVDSVNQLFRVIDGTIREKDLPLANDKSVFNQTSISDNKYFKHIRAIFSTHPVNLTSVDGVGNNTGEKFYASWAASNGSGDGGGYCAYLYSNNPNREDQFFEIKIKDLNLYAEKRYQLLEVLIEKVKVIKKEHVELQKQTLVPIVDNPIEQLEILSEENTRRFGREAGYAGMIYRIHSQLGIDTTVISAENIQEIINEYKGYLVSLIPKIINGLQNMNADDQLKYMVNNPKRGYEFETIYRYFLGEDHPAGKEYFQYFVKKKELPDVFIKTENTKLARLFLDAYVHQEYQKHGKPILYTDIINTKANEKDCC